MATNDIARDSLLEMMGNPYLTPEQFDEFNRRLKLLDEE